MTSGSDAGAGGVPSLADKEEAYLTVSAEIAAVLEGETDAVARMATLSCLLHQAFGHFFWTGFYVVDPAKGDELVVGPYQGTLGCLRIPFGQGVCGTAAATGETQIVEDVHAFPGHIACDARTNSEIVVPVRDAGGRLIAVLDIDSEASAAFDGTDARHLEKILADAFAI
jgi:GAF domain-containing protein